MPNFALDATHAAQFGGDGGTNLAIADAAIADAIHLCREGALPVTIADEHPTITFGPDVIHLSNYDDITDLTGSLSQLLTDTPATTSDISAADCKTFFEADLPTLPTSIEPSTIPTISTSDVESSKTQSLQGTGIEFGYDFEKYSLSFNQLQWSGGDDKLQAQMLLFRYFLPYALSVGGGFASAKLDTEFGSDSGTAPVFHFGYDYPITKNFQISLSYAWLGVNLAVQDTQSVTTTRPVIITNNNTTPSSIQKRAVVGLFRVGGAIRSMTMMHSVGTSLWILPLILE